MKGFNEIDSTADKTYEYAFTPVPKSKRKHTGRLVMILLGFAFSVSGLVTGGTVGMAMSFGRAAGVCFMGNLIMFGIALFWGLQGYNTGDSSIFRVKKELGEQIGILFAVVIVTAVIIWIGMTGELLAKFIVGTFRGWPLPVSVTALITVSAGIFSSRNGWQSLERLNGILVPFIILLLLVNVMQVNKLSPGFAFITQYQPVGNLTILTALAMVIGNFVLASTVIADICRFARSRKAVIICISVYAAALMLSDLFGIMIIQATGAQNLNYGLFLLGSVPRSCIWLMLCAFTTQNVNLYIGSLAIQSLLRKTAMSGNISYKTAAYFIGAVAVIIAVVGIRRGFLVFTRILVLLVLPLTIALAVKLFHRQRSREKG